MAGGASLGAGGGRQIAKLRLGPGCSFLLPTPQLTGRGPRQTTGVHCREGCGVHGRRHSDPELSSSQPGTLLSLPPTPLVSASIPHTPFGRWGPQHCQPWALSTLTVTPSCLDTETQPPAWVTRQGCPGLGRAGRPGVLKVSPGPHPCLASPPPLLAMAESAKLQLFVKVPLGWEGSPQDECALGGTLLSGAGSGSPKAHLCPLPGRGLRQPYRG